MSVTARVDNLRNAMDKHKLDAFIVNGMDPHMSEYAPQRWESRAYISGFKGSYGHFAATKKEAALWTDSRYFLQAEQELEGTGIVMMKDRVAGAQSYDAWLLERLEKGSRVGIDGFTLASGEAERLKIAFAEKEIELITDKDLLNDIWSDRPELPKDGVYEVPVETAGESRLDKIENIRSKYQEKGANATIITALDDLAWTFNIRSSDVSYNPVLVGYAWIDDLQTILFIQEGKLDNDLAQKFYDEHIAVMPYDEMADFSRSRMNKTIYIDGDRTNYALSDILRKNNNLLQGLSIPCLAKSRKNAIEIEGMQKAHLLDGVAMVNFLHWLDSTMGKEEITEMTICEKLYTFRSDQEGFVGESFPSIVGYADRGAIVHYHCTPESDRTIDPKGMLLVDSGGQYLCGTTDITRTAPVGEVSEQMRKDFTLALKGMIQLSIIQFPKGTPGCHLDILARQAMWKEGLNYGHGTGHGVGFFMNVHEGPMSIRPDLNPLAIEKGNVLSNEPAFYREGQYGIRTENVMVCEERQETEFGQFLGFHTFTLCPIDLRLIAIELLNEEERTWINNYHQRVATELTPLLAEEQKVWLTEMTKSI